MVAQFLWKLSQVVNIALIQYLLTKTQKYMVLSTAFPIWGCDAWEPTFN